MRKHIKMEENDDRVSLVTLADQISPVSEQYRAIRTNIQYSMSELALKTLVITSSGPGEGKSTTAANLAIVFANTGKRVLLVDADLRKPTVAKSFSLKNGVGLSNILGSHQSENLKNIIQSSGVENLFVLTSGPKPPNPSELLGTVKMSRLFDSLKSRFDLIVFDLPPVVTVTDAQILAAKADAAILVAREGVSQKDSLKKAKELLNHVGANILGVVYNGAKNVIDQGYYYE